MEQKRKLNSVASFPEVSCDGSLAELYQPSPVDELLMVEGVDLNGNKTVKHVNDIFLLFNQQRLASLGTDTVNKWLESLTPKNDALAELRSKCTDEQLLQFVKSKYIQSASELEAWSTYLNTHFDSEIATLAALNAENESEEEEEISSSASTTSETKSE